MKTYDELQTAAPDELEDWLIQVAKSFNLQFDINELANIQTFGQLVDHITNKFTLVHTDTCSSQQAFYKLKLAIEHLWAPQSITPQTLLADILPRKNRIYNVKKLEKQLGMKLTLLEPPVFVLSSLFMLLLASLAIFFVSRYIGVLGLSFSLSGFWVASKLGKELAVSTVGALTKRITRTNYLLARRDAQTVNRKEIEHLLADWLCEDLGLSRTKLTRDSRFS